MLIEDHINFSGQNPLVGPNDDDFGPRFPRHVARLRPEAARILRCPPPPRAGVTLAHGVYVYVLGPSFETPAEIRMFAGLGADAVGMSTVPECIAAVHCGMKVAALSVVTKSCGRSQQCPVDAPRDVGRSGEGL